MGGWKGGGMDYAERWNGGDDFFRGEVGRLELCWFVKKVHIEKFQPNGSPLSTSTNTSYYRPALLPRTQTHDFLSTNLLFINLMYV